MKRRSQFNNKFWPYLLLTPHIVAIAVFILWPAYEALKESFFRSDAFGIHTVFVGFSNFITLFHDHTYLNSLWVTVVFSVSVTAVAMAVALFMASLVNRSLSGTKIYNTLFIWPYAVAPVIAGVLWSFLFNPSVGIIAHLLQEMGYNYNYFIYGKQALLLVVLAAAWQQFSYNFIFFLAGLKSVPNSLMEAAAIDGASPMRRFWNITFPLLSPTTFFLMVTNLVYAFFSTFGIIQVVTQGGPANATNILVYRVYRDGFIGLNFGSSATQSVILMIIVTILVIIQFKYIEKQVHY